MDKNYMKFSPQFFVCLEAEYPKSYGADFDDLLLTRNFCNDKKTDLL